MPIDRFEKLAEGLEIEPYKLMGWDVHDILSYDNEYKDDADIIDLYRNYNKLDEHSQKKLLEYSFDLVYAGKYSKDDSSKSVKSIANESDEYIINTNIDINSNSNSNSNSSSNSNSNSNNYTSLEEKFTTIAAHDDGLGQDEIMEMDNIFFDKLSKKDK